MEEEISYSTVVFKDGVPPSKEEKEDPTIYSTVTTEGPDTTVPEKKEEPSIYSTVTPEGPATTVPDGEAAAHSHSRVSAVCLGTLCVFLLASISAIIYISVVMNEQKANLNSLTAEKQQLITEKSILERNTEELSRVKDNLNQTLAFILEFNVFPVDKYCSKKKCQPCHTDWIPFQEKCYYFHDTYPWFSWGMSRTYCQNIASDLVVIDSLQEQEFIGNHTRFYHDMYHGYWLGLRMADDKYWVWVDGRNDTLGYWMPMTLGTSGPYALMIPGGNPTATWDLAEGEMKNKFICEREALKWSS